MNARRTHMQGEPRSSGLCIAEELQPRNDRPRMLLAMLVVLFVLASAIRLYRLQEQPGVLIDRDYTSSILARDFFFQQSDNVAVWRKEMTHLLKQRQPVLEPPVTEFLVSLLYRAAGGEHVWLARVLTSLFWLTGGVFLYKLAKMIVPTEAAVFATAYYLLVPSSILISRSFQPDALMMLTFLASLFSILKYYQQPSGVKLGVAAVITGLTLVHRPLVLFALFAAFIALAIAQRGIWKGIFHRQVAAFLVIGLLPTALYYGYGVFIADFLRWKVETSFRPYLLFHREFWIGWLDGVLEVIGTTALIVALIGLPALRRGLSRALVVGLGIGYAAFGLLFTMHIHTHGYYHAQLIPVIAMPLGAMIALTVNWLKAACVKWYWWLPAVGALALVMFSDLREVRGHLGKQVFESAEVAKEIGSFVRHSSRIVFLARYYGLPLQYNGELIGHYWPRSISYWLYRRPDQQNRSVENRLQALGFTPEYFVITDFNEYNKHHTDLKEYLTQSCSVLAETPQYLIYYSCKSTRAHDDLTYWRSWRSQADAEVRQYTGNSHHRLMNPRFPHADRSSEHAAAFDTAVDVFGAHVPPSHLPTDRFLRQGKEP
jgi:4-amino-4-deoxy-L-arabinose transferase-like glycosyltransferase